MIVRYARIRVNAQIRSVAFIVLYLWAFQLLVLRDIPDTPLRIAAGIVMVVCGLAVFLEGLVLGLMPLGERVGLQLPRRFGLAATLAFGLLLGIGVTLAEPAIATLRMVGGSVTPWDAPLRYLLLERMPYALVAAIALGVGMAVMVGMFRFHFGFSLKGFVYILIPALIALTAYAGFDPSLAGVLGLAWDAGAVTTGPVTVPLVLALGIGASRSSRRQQPAAGAFGVIMLASAFPVLAVLALGIFLRAGVPAPCTERHFFSSALEASAMPFASTMDDLERLAFQRGQAEGRLALAGSDDEHRRAVLALAQPGIRARLLGGMPLETWIRERASSQERRWLNAEIGRTGREGDVPADRVPAGAIARQETAKAVKAIVPLAALLLIALLVFLRGRPRYRDEIALGIVLSVGGMALLTAGIRLGLAPLGTQVGRPLPRLFNSIMHEERPVLIEAFNPEQVYTALAPDGKRHPFFFLKPRPDAMPEAVPYEPAQYDADSGQYEVLIRRPPRPGFPGAHAGFLLVLIFAFGLGYGATLAEPAMRALGRTVEEVTAGAIRGQGIIRAVSVGVGLGLLAGMVRLLYAIPFPWMIIPPYALAMILTHWSDDDISNVAWDSGGVTTGVVTVPLVMAMGIGMGGPRPAMDGFGILALASVYPVLTVLLYGIVRRAQRQHSRRLLEREQDDA